LRKGTDSSTRREEICRDIRKAAPLAKLQIQGKEERESGRNFKKKEALSEAKESRGKDLSLKKKGKGPALSLERKKGFYLS